MIEVNDNPTIAYAVNKTNRIVTQDNIKLLSPEDLEEWEAACDGFESVTDDQQDAWVDMVMTTYPAMDELPEPETHNDIN